MLAALAAALALVLAPGARTFSVDPGASAVRYHVVHKLHRVEATSSRVEGKAVIQPDNRLLVMARAPVATFDSGDGNRDAHMQEVMETGRFPFVVLKAVARLDGAALVASGGPRTVEVKLEGELELHGVKAPLVVPVQVELRPDGTVRARASFDVSLDAHGIERPSLLLVKVDDACRIDVDLVLREVKS
jgi:polyisoprenoid-binding protein YceI